MKPNLKQSTTPYMTVAEFLVWYEEQPEGERYELLDGVPYAMSPERVRHGRQKLSIVIALRDAIKNKGLSCEALPDGMGVLIEEGLLFEPDALVVCDSDLSGDELVVPNPIVVVEVINPRTSAIDTGAKFHAYFSLPSIKHYLIIDPVAKIIVHHFRNAKGTLESEVISKGRFTLKPLGLEIDHKDVF